MRTRHPIQSKFFAFCLGICFHFCCSSVAQAALEPSISLKTWTLGDYELSLAPELNQVILKKGQFKTIAFESPEGHSFLSVDLGRLNPRENRGSFVLDYQTSGLCRQQTIDHLEGSDNQVIIQGRFEGNKVCKEIVYQLSFQVDVLDPSKLLINIQCDPRISQINLHLKASETRIYGGGIQPGLINLKGQKIPLLVQEGGIGRSAWPVSPLLALFSPGSEGSLVSSYFPMPVFWHSLEGGQYQAISVLDSEPGFLDFSHHDQTTISLFSDQMHVSLQVADEPLKLSQVFRGQAPLPDWVHQGAIVGIQGGTAKVQKIWQELKRRGTPVSAFWLQDWVGRRETLIGSQLWWNWELDHTHYADWQTLKHEFGQNNVRILGYINPFLVDVSMRSHRRNLYREAAELGFLIHDEAGAIYPIQNTDFAAGMLDLSNPAAYQWFQSIIQDELIEQAGFSGWMADYAEALPLDAHLFKGNALKMHNQYPEMWSRLHQDAIQSSSCRDCFFFTRSGYLNSAVNTPLFWSGDQMTDWGAEDGLVSSLNALLSGSLSGLVLNHSDAGGYTSIVQLGIYRSKELLFRWLEMNAFTAILRTHEGNQPEANAQFYSDSESFAFFDKMAKIYAALYSYRKILFQEAVEKGTPVVRSLLLQYPDDIQASAIQDQFLLGPDFLIAPVLRPGKIRRELYLPVGVWVHLWSGRIYDFSKNGKTIQIDAPLGEPPVFYRQGSSFGVELNEYLIKTGIISP